MKASRTGRTARLAPEKERRRCNRADSRQKQQRKHGAGVPAVKLGKEKSGLHRAAVPNSQSSEFAERVCAGTLLQPLRAADSSPISGGGPMRVKPSAEQGTLDLGRGCAFE